jgi:DNA-binding MarR family transcriptional regulator
MTGVTHVEALERLLDEVRLAMHRLVQVSEALHAREPVTLGMRAILEFALKNGPTSVPGIARSRHVSRQHIQALVNPLLEQGLAELRENPAHRRSPLVALTPAGERLIRRMRRKEERAFGRMATEVPAAEIDGAARTLRAVRLSLEA